MPDEPITPPTPRQALIARTEQAALVVLALVLVAGVAWRAAAHFGAGTPPLALVPAPDGPNFRVNVNTADWVTLALVPGLGPALSKRIVEARQARPARRFDSLDDLLQVRGIGEKMLARLRPYLSLDDSAPTAEPIEMKPVP
jgi:DNA uptake protein ComE-like DNA-binding protein